VKTVRFAASALDKLRSLETQDRKQIGYALHLFATTGAGDVKMLKDLGGSESATGVSGSLKIQRELSVSCVSIAETKRTRIDFIAAPRRG
jgi:hypothetical protein